MTEQQILKYLKAVKDPEVPVIDVVGHEHDIAEMTDRSIHLTDGVIDNNGHAMKAKRA